MGIIQFFNFVINTSTETAKNLAQFS